MDTIGSLIDKLCTVDLKLWNNQEALFPIRHMDFDQFYKQYNNRKTAFKLWKALKKTCDLNVQRSDLIDEIDETIVKLVQAAIHQRRLDKFVQRKHKTY